jgi:triacylglycerol lipase
MADRQPSRHLIAPELAAALDYLPDLDFTPDMAAFRSGLDARMMPPLPPELEAVPREERFAPGLNGAPDVRFLLYTPPGAATGPRPAVLHIHGGGYIMGSPEINDGMNRQAALELGCVVVSVDYRLAPETAWPGALEDCYAALLWLQAHAAELNVDMAHVAVAGESAGGGHAAALAQYALDKSREDPGAPTLCFQLLDCPMLDDRSGTGHADPHPYTGEFVWTPKRNQFGWTAMLGMEAGSDGVPEAAVPARRKDLSGLPPTFIALGALDLFLEESLEYVRRLSRVGVPVELHVIPGAYHGFSVAQGAPQVTLNAQLRKQALARALGVVPA